MGGLPEHPCRGSPCVIGWKFETSDSYMVYIDNDPRNIGFEIASLDELIPLE